LKPDLKFKEYLSHELENLSLNLGGIFERRALRKISDIIGDEVKET
jgi:hypothetical protein